jgi:hypothetical protein
MEPLAVSTRVAGSLLDVSHDTIERLVAQGALPRVPHLGVIRIPVAALKAFAEKGAA